MDTENPNPTHQPEQPPLKRPKMSTTSTNSDDEAAGKSVRYKRRKIAIFFAYCGVGYQGMQKNPGAKTIEEDLEEALFLSGAVPEADRGQPKRFDWARSARTDKGVSAVGQVVSGRFYVDPPGFIDRLNSNLCPQIRIFGYKRTIPSFNAKKFCDRRRYVYLLPVFALDATCHRDRESVLASLGSGNELAKCNQCSERGRKVLGVMGNKRNLGFCSSDISSNTRDALLLNAAENDVSDSLTLAGVSSNTESELGVDGGDECKVFAEDKNGDVGMVDSESLIHSGVSSSIEGELVVNGGDGSKVFVEDNNGDMSTVDCESLVCSGISPDSESVLLVAEVKGECNGCSDDTGVAGLILESVEKEESKVKRSEFQYDEEVKERFNRILKHYVGTHNFHNFTTRTKAEDPSAKRYIVSFDANTTLTLEGIEFVKCEVIGQSFMLHQIRKMMGLAVAVMRNFTPESIYERAFDQDFKINVPTAPEVGLYLDECFFTSYNSKWKNTHEEVSMKDYAQEAEEFKLKYIYSHVAKTELKEGSVAVWLHSLNHRNYPDLCFPNDEVKEATNIEVEKNNEVEKVARDEVKDAINNKVEEVANGEVKDATNNEVEKVGNNDVKEAANNQQERSNDEVEEAVNKEVENAANDEGKEAANNPVERMAQDEVKSKAQDEVEKTANDKEANF